MNNLEELKQELVETKNRCAELEKKINELEKQKSAVRWRAKEDEGYCYLDNCGGIQTERDFYHKVDTDRYDLANYFKTEEEAEKMLNKIKIYTQLKDLALRLNKDKEIDWDDKGQGKYFIYYDNLHKKICTTCNYWTEVLGQIYCLDENFLEEAKKEIGEENLKKLFE